MLREEEEEEGEEEAEREGAVLHKRLRLTRGGGTTVALCRRL